MPDEEQAQAGDEVRAVGEYEFEDEYGDEPALANKLKPVNQLKGADPFYERRVNSGKIQPVKSFK